MTIEVPIPHPRNWADRYFLLKKSNLDALGVRFEAEESLSDGAGGLYLYFSYKAKNNKRVWFTVLLGGLWDKSGSWRDDLVLEDGFRWMDEGEE